MGHFRKQKYHLNPKAYLPQGIIPWDLINLKEGKESSELLPECPTDSRMEMETIIKRPEVNLEDAKDADERKSKVMNMLESKFASIVSKIFYRRRMN